MTTKKNKKKLRVDELLVEKKLCPTKKEASALIYEGKVYTSNRKILNPSEMLSSDEFIGIKGVIKTFASRAGEKLESAIKALHLEQAFKDQVVLDIGSSTGGFTDCVLGYGAKTVIALDVGTNQLVWELRNNKKVISVEQTHIKDFNPASYQEIDFVVADISFNSLAKLSSPIIEVSKKKDLKLLLLVKPQFELPKEMVSEKGLVTKKEYQIAATEKVRNSFEEKGFCCLGTVDSLVKGKTGNQETFLYFTRKDPN